MKFRIAILTPEGGLRFVCCAPTEKEGSIPYRDAKPEWYPGFLDSEVLCFESKESALEFANTLKDERFAYVFRVEENAPCV